MRNEQYLEVAKVIAQTSHCGRKKVGAVIVKNGRIISTGYNGIPKPLRGGCFEIKSEETRKLGYLIKGFCGGCSDVIHAEQNAIFAAAKAGISLEGSILYVTLSPCIDCAKGIIMSGITKVVYGQPYKGDLGVEYLKAAGIEVELVRGDY